MSKPPTEPANRSFVIEVPVVLSVAVFAASQEEAERMAKAQIDRHFGNEPQAEHAHLGEMSEIVIAKCTLELGLPPIKVVIHLNPDGQEPDVYSNAACDMAIICTDEKDLQDYGEDDVFKLPVRHPVKGKTTVDAVGHIDHAEVPDSSEQNYVEQVFLAIRHHGESDIAVNSPAEKGDAP